MRPIRNRIASRTLIERGDIRRGAIRRAAAWLRRELETGAIVPVAMSRQNLRNMLAMKAEEIQREIAGQTGKYRTT